MMKKFSITFMCICILFTTIACGASNAAEKAIPLTYGSTNINFHNVIETEEGVTIFCSSNYVLEPEDNGQFLFMLSKWSEECLETDYDRTVEFVSNGHIYQSEFFDYEGNCIATEECNGSVTIDQEYGATYIDKVVLYIEYEDALYTATFIRGKW